MKRLENLGRTRVLVVVVPGRSHLSSTKKTLDEQEHASTIICRLSPQLTLRKKKRRRPQRNRVREGDEEVPPKVGSAALTPHLDPSEEAAAVVPFSTGLGALVQLAELIQTAVTTRWSIALV
jgi:hypothetical protein